LIAGNRPLYKSAVTLSAVNAGDRQKILGDVPFPSALGGPFADPLIAPFPASGALCACADDVISASSVLFVG